MHQALFISRASKKEVSAEHLSPCLHVSHLRDVIHYHYSEQPKKGSRTIKSSRVFSACKQRSHAKKTTFRACQALHTTCQVSLCLSFLPEGTPISKNFLDQCLQGPTRQPQRKDLSFSSFCLHFAGLQSWWEGRGASSVGRGFQRNNQENHQALSPLPCARGKKWWVWATEKVRIWWVLLGEREPRGCKSQDL